MKRAAGYLRVSRERDGMKAPEIYGKQIRDYARKEGLPPAEQG
jgi:DNA invertase Pin-like site-specific DNA recombinase